MASYIMVAGFIIWIIAFFVTWILSFQKYEKRYDTAYSVVILSIFPLSTFFAIVACSSGSWDQFGVSVGFMILLSIISLSTDPLISLKKRVTRWMYNRVAEKNYRRK